MVVGGVANESQRKQKVMNGMRATLSLLVGAAIAMTTSVAYAQDIGGSSAPASGGSSGGSITDTSGPTDHSQVVGRMGLRYFGSTSVPALVRALDSMGVPGRDISASASGGTLHTVGGRYWLNSNLALEGGLAFGFQSGGTTTTTTAGAGTTTVAADNPNFFGIGVQVGLPIMVAEAKHLSIHFDPYLALHYGHSAITLTPANDETRDLSLNAVLFKVGANATAELQFGFLGIPQLGLQATLGVELAYGTSSFNTVVTTTRAGQQPRTETTASASGFSIGTTVGPNYSLAEMITGSISAVYYFGSAPGTQH